MSTCLKSEIFRLSVGVDAGMPAVGEGALLGDQLGIPAATPSHGSMGAGLCAGSVLIVLWS